MNQRIAHPALVPLMGLGFLTIHWVNQWIGTYGLMFDEAQYWFWAKHPAWGYYSKPPVIAWLIALSTAMFGDGNFGVKMFSPLLLLGTGGMLYATARRLGHSRPIAAWVFATYLTLPVVSGNAMFFTTDVPLQFCWAVGLYGVIAALRSGKPGWWLLAGAAGGLGLLSKYTMVAFAASTLLALVVIPANRVQLRRPWPWVAALIAALLLAPNLMWNAHHHFVTFTHTNDNVFSKQIEIYPEDMLSFMLAQLGVFGPILLITLVNRARQMKHADQDVWLLHCFVWPLALAGIIVALLAGAQAHWISPVYLAATLIVVPWLAQHRPGWLRASFALHCLVLLLFYLFPLAAAQMPEQKSPLTRLFVWDRLADDVRPLVQHYPDAVLMTNERKVAAAFTYRLRDLRGSADPVYKWPPNGPVRDHYDLIGRMKDFSHHQRLLILRYSYFDDAAPDPRAVLLERLQRGKYKFAIYLLPADQESS